MKPSALVAIIILLIWGAVLAIPAFGWSVHDVPRWAAALFGLWLLLNFYAWMAPTWRTQIVTARGPLLGFGFAFAGALISSVADAFAVGIASALLLFLWRAILLSLPFALALNRRLRPYPHWSDFGVLLFAWLLPLVPGFDGSWFVLEGVGRVGLFAVGFGGDALHLGPGRLLGLALISTYFYGARAWTAAPLDWMLREKDAIFAVRMTVLGTVGAIVAHYTLDWVGLGAQSSWIQMPQSSAGWAFVAFGLILAPVAEELTFRGILQSGISKVAPRSLLAWKHSALATAALVAVLHAAAGSFGLSTGAAFGLSLGIALVYIRTNRLLPAILAHGAAWAILAIAALWI